MICSFLVFNFYSFSLLQENGSLIKAVDEASEENRELEQAYATMENKIQAMEQELKAIKQELKEIKQENTDLWELLPIEEKSFF